ncbi:jg5592 [Pararge aegeria aegeria]|uniref:Jg5592 protein n=1 Tax=Pararge aegeria aegeria TaxID=348720 RepID=A0A8S4S0E9_9NEOP|nr:jg5592 [Pararge aegeria aegeria]
MLQRFPQSVPTGDGCAQDHEGRVTTGQRSCCGCSRGIDFRTLSSHCEGPQRARLLKAGWVRGEFGAVVSGGRAPSSVEGCHGLTAAAADAWSVREVARRAGHCPPSSLRIDRCARSRRPPT